MGLLLVTAIILLLLLYAELRLRRFSASASFPGPPPAQTPAADQPFSIVAAVAATQRTTTAWLAAVTGSASSDRQWSLYARPRVSSRSSQMQPQPQPQPQPLPQPPPQPPSPPENLDLPFQLTVQGIIQQVANNLPAWEQAVERLMKGSLQQHEAVRSMAEPLHGLARAAETVAGGDERSRARVRDMAAAFERQTNEGLQLADNTRQLSAATYAAAELVARCAAAAHSCLTAARGVAGALVGKQLS